MLLLLLSLPGCVEGNQAKAGRQVIPLTEEMMRAPTNAPPPAPPSVIPVASAAPAPPAYTLIEKPIPFPEERVRLTLDYRRQHQGYAGNSVQIRPEVVVLHWTGGGSAQGAWNTFAPVEAANARPDLAGAAAVNVSAHFIVDRDGTVWRLMPEDWMARHCIGLNHLSIGIENAGDADLGATTGSPLTEAQVQANIALVRDLATRWPIRVVVGHLEARRLEGTPLFVETDPKYRTGKPDPGPRFTEAVRAGLKDLGITGPEGAAPAPAEMQPAEAQPAAP